MNNNVKRTIREDKTSMTGLMTAGKCDSVMDTCVRETVIDPAKGFKEDVAATLSARDQG